MISNAQFSPCRRYRYTLTRRWGDGHWAMFIGLNPSTADEFRNDNTVTRCIEFAKDWGFGALYMTNIFAFRATDPKVMKREPDPIGPDNDGWLRACAAQATVVVAAWGTHGVHLGRGAEVKAMIPLLHVLKLTKGGHPNHPLYLPKTLSPTLWV